MALRHTLNRLPKRHQRLSTGWWTAAARRPQDAIQKRWMKITHLCAVVPPRRPLQPRPAARMTSEQCVCGHESQADDRDRRMGPASVAVAMTRKCPSASRELWCPVETKTSRTGRRKWTSVSPLCATTVFERPRLRVSEQRHWVREKNVHN